MIFESVLESRLTELIEGMGVDEQYEIYKEYCMNTSNYDDEPFVCDESTLDDLCYGMRPSEIVERYGDIDFSWDYFIDGIYGVEEWCGIDYVSDVVDYIMRNEDNLMNNEIWDLLDNFNKELYDYIYEIYENDSTLVFEELKDLVIESIKDDFDMDNDEIESEMEEIEYFINEYIDDNTETEDEE